MSIVVFAMPLLFGQVAAGALATRYPQRPVPLPDSEEIALARSAAPAAISGSADVYAVRAGSVVRLASGTNGCTCFVSRDYHPGNSYPVCYNPAASQTLFKREAMEVRLRTLGVPEGAIRDSIASAFASGRLSTSTRLAVVYMMSPRQVLFSSPDSSGVRVGAWWPHLMISASGLKAGDLGIPAESQIRAFTFDHDRHVDQWIVHVPEWSDGTPARVP